MLGYALLSVPTLRRLAHILLPYRTISSLELVSFLLLFCALFFSQIVPSDYIDSIAQKIADFSVKEGNTDTLKRLTRLLKENAEATGKPRQGHQIGQGCGGAFGTD